MLQRIKDIYKQQEALQKEIEELQSICSHKVIQKDRYRSNDEYDAFAQYKYKCYCEACDKHWTEDENIQRKNTIVVIKSNLKCACNCATPCPLGKTGSSLRCTLSELADAGIACIIE